MCQACCTDESGCINRKADLPVSPWDEWKGHPVSTKSLDIEHGEWFTPPQAAKEGRIPSASNEKAVRDLIAKREIGFVVRNGRYYISSAHIRQFIRKHEQKAVA